MITDEQIFNHMLVDSDESCTKCGGETEKVEYSHYITFKCLSCGYEPEPEEEL